MAGRRRPGACAGGQVFDDPADLEPGERQTACQPRQHAGRCAAETVLVSGGYWVALTTMGGASVIRAAHAPHAVYRHHRARPVAGLHGPGNGRDRVDAELRTCLNESFLQNRRLDAQPQRELAMPLLRRFCRSMTRFVCGQCLQIARKMVHRSGQLWLTDHRGRPSGAHRHRWHPRCHPRQSRPRVGSQVALSVATRASVPPERLTSDTSPHSTFEQTRPNRPGEGRAQWRLGPGAGQQAQHGQQRQHGQHHNPPDQPTF